MKTASTEILIIIIIIIKVPKTEAKLWCVWKDEGREYRPCFLEVNAGGVAGGR